MSSSRSPFYLRVLVREPYDENSGLVGTAIPKEQDPAPAGVGPEGAAGVEASSAVVLVRPVTKIIPNMSTAIAT